MNLTYQEGLALAEAINNAERADDILVILGTPAIHLAGVSAILEGSKNVKLAAQNCHRAEKGAYTGNISIGQIKSTGAQYVILGHSERREYHGETDDLIAEKVNLVLSHELLPIYCCGEKLPTREAGNHVELVSNQIKEALFHLSAEEFQKIVIAYEPVWAIGTGVTASPEQAQEMHKEIRTLIASKYGEAIADDTTILYGGSMKPKNAKELLAQPDVDGGLVGGASLKADDFVAIINSF